MSDESIDKMRQTMIERHGSFEAWQSYMKEMGSKGGKESHRRMSKEKATEIGRLGGLAKAKKFRERGSNLR